MNVTEIPSLENLRDSTAKLASDRAEAEQAVAGLAFSDTRNIFPVKNCGIVVGSFSHGDYRLLFLAAVVCADAGKPELRQEIARMALQRAGKWAPNGPIHHGTRPHWNSESIALFGATYYHCPITATYWAERLRNLCRREAAARWHLREAIRALHGDANLHEQQPPVAVGRAA